MVLSNKKLKQKLRAELAESLVASVAKPESINNGSTKPDLSNQSQQPQSLKALLDSATQRPRLSKREKRRKNLSLQGIEAVNYDGSEEKKENGSEGLVGKKRKRKREGDGNEKDGVLGSEENGVVEKSIEKQGKKKKTKRKKQKNRKKEAKNEEKKEAAEFGNEEKIVTETIDKNERYFKSDYTNIPRLSFIVSTIIYFQIGFIFWGG